MNQTQQVLLGALLAWTTLFSTQAMAELDAELAAASPRDVSGFYLGPKLNLGLVTPTEPGSSGFTASVGGFMGLNLSHGLWGLWQLGLDLELGRAQFRTGSGDQSAKHQLQFAALGIRSGLGQKIGLDTFGLFSFGIGPAFSGYKITRGDRSAKATDPLSGYFIGIGYDVLYRAAEYLNVGVGYHYDHFSYDVDELKEGGQSFKVGHSLPFNSQTVTIKLALHL